MMSAQNRLLVVCGLLISVASASVTALAVSLSRSPAVTAPPQPVLSLAASTSGNTITVVGVGIGSATPNQAQLYLGVQATRPNVRDAVSVAAGDMTHLLSAVHNQGVQDKDIQTTGVSVSQQTNCCPQTVNGYNASTQITVTVHSINNITPLIEVAVDAVGNDLQIGGVNLSVAAVASMLKAARANAMNDAKAKAADYAALSGHHVGGLIGVSEIVSTTGGFSWDQCGAKGVGGGVSSAPGVSAISVTVSPELGLQSTVSSAIWNAVPSRSPYRRSAPTTSGVASDSSAPDAHAAANSEAVLPRTTRRYDSRSPG